MKNISKYIIYTLMLLASIISCSREEENLNEKTSDTKEIYYYEKIRISFVNNSGVPLLI